MIEIYALQSTEKLEESLFAYLCHFVDDSKRRKINRFLHWEDAQRGLLADLMIRDIIVEKTKLENEIIHFSFNQYRKPFLNNLNDFYFNLSHSGNWIVCAIDNNPIGIDVEQIKSIDFDISRNYFSYDEHIDLMNKGASERLSYFFTLWTLKESYIKAEGKGLSIPLKSFSIRAEDNHNIHFKLNNVKGEGNHDKYFRMYNIDDNYKLSVCASNQKFPNSVIIKHLDDLIESFTVYEAEKYIYGKTEYSMVGFNI